ncbi:cupin domain-containing protein [Jeotgalibacillus malaysiensis]|uniref:cupin domain-containing protein n=1 Tax=Jeotgalibacillus malaysiensis TaxID=1508404 RepID=UPI0038512A1B
MKIFQIEKDKAKHVTHFGSECLLNPLISSNGEYKTSFVTLEAGGIIGFHEAAVPQLMMVISGSGEVCSEDKKYQPVKQEDVIFWERGEWHESISAQGMTALIIEGPALKESHIHLKETV